MSDDYMDAHIVNGKLRSPSIEIHSDPVAEKIDELADLCEYWKKNRSRGRTPSGIQGAIMIVMTEIAVLHEGVMTSTEGGGCKTYDARVVATHSGDDITMIVCRNCGRLPHPSIDNLISRSIVR